GSAWTEVALPANLLASALALPTANRVLVGTTNGRLFRIDWSGAAWGGATELTSPRGAWISDLLVDPSNANRLWATSTAGRGRRSAACSGPARSRPTPPSAGSPIAGPLPGTSSGRRCRPAPGQAGHNSAGRSRSSAPAPSW